jgi:hypothetical protein
MTVIATFFMEDRAEIQSVSPYVVEHRMLARYCSKLVAGSGASSNGCRREKAISNDMSSANLLLALPMKSHTSSRSSWAK